MSYLSNLHTHTDFCDGVDSADAMVKRAVSMGYKSLGFSGHSYAPFDVPNCMTEQGTGEYVSEILRLREKYRDKIQIYLGIEQDMMYKMIEYPYDYVIGSMHYIKIGDEYVSVDYTDAIAENAVKKYFSGDWYRYCEAYYASVKDVAKITGCNIVGHFDLVTKFNEGNKYFDENSYKYRASAIEALRAVAQDCNLFEINTGGIYRRKRSAPYPADFLLRELHKIGGEIVFSSDSHDEKSLGFMFFEASELANSCGFRYAKLLLDGKFTDVRL